MRARAAGPRRRHRRVHAELPCLVARGADDAAIAGPADDDGLAGQARIVELLDRRVERVEVDVEDARVVAHQPAITRSRADHAQRTARSAVHLVGVLAAAVGLPAFGQPLAQRFPHPRRARLEPVGALPRGHERGLDDDAVRDPRRAGRRRTRRRGGLRIASATPCRARARAPRTADRSTRATTSPVSSSTSRVSPASSDASSASMTPPGVLQSS